MIALCLLVSMISAPDPNVENDDLVRLVGFLNIDKNRGYILAVPLGGNLPAQRDARLFFTQSSLEERAKTLDGCKISISGYYGSANGIQCVVVVTIAEVIPEPKR